jgi:hypothetical protein
MTYTQIEMAEDEFDAQYPLMPNHLNPNASRAFGDGPGCLFETYGEELECVQQQDPNTVWTFVDGDDGDQYLVSGYHLVNRIGYLISTVAVPEGLEIEVRIPTQSEPSDEPAEEESAGSQPDQPIGSIARDYLGITTLDTQGRDSLDFHDIAVWQVEAALKAAFNSGVKSNNKNAEAQAVRPAGHIPAKKPNPLLVPKGTSLISGKMYLRLYHGRTDPAQEMDEWGFDGPTFGPLSSYVHTYCCHFRIHSEFGTSEIWLDKHDDMIHWNGCFYGDMEVFIAGTKDKA